MQAETKGFDTLSLRWCLLPTSWPSDTKRILLGYNDAILLASLKTNVSNVPSIPTVVQCIWYNVSNVKVLRPI